MTWSILALLMSSIVGCRDMRAAQTTLATMTAPSPVPSPTLPPTAVPGSRADEQNVADTVRQFGEAVAHGDETVALLVLSPSAQQIVASSDLHTFLGEGPHLQRLDVRRVRLNGDVAIAECTIRDTGEEQSLELQLVRLDGVWKIDAPVDE